MRKRLIIVMVVALLAALPACKAFTSVADRFPDEEIGHELDLYFEDAKTASIETAVSILWRLIASAFTPTGKGGSR